MFTSRVKKRLRLSRRRRLDGGLGSTDGLRLEGRTYPIHWAFLTKYSYKQSGLPDYSKISALA